jgi:hypothetical protein
MPLPTQRFAARVLSIAPAVDAQRGAVEVKFTLLQAPPAYLREDMTLSVEVETARRERALVMPLAALCEASTPDGLATVLVSADGRAGTRAVRLGLRTLDAAEVLEGLAPGETVLLGRHSAMASACGPGRWRGSPARQRPLAQLAGRRRRAEQRHGALSLHDALARLSNCAWRCASCAKAACRRC